MKRNKFSLSHYRLTTMDMGTLVPISWYEGLPGDSIQQQTSLLLRATPLIAPVMHPVRVRLHTFFVPNRIIWDDWENFITGGEDGMFEAQPPLKNVDFNVAVGTLWNYLGIPTGDYSSNPALVSALPFRAYQMIYNEYYRDEQLSTAKSISKASGTDTTTDANLNLIAWEKDYFTTARPSPSLGEEIYIPLGESAPVVGVGTKQPVFNSAVATGRNLQHDSTVNVMVSGTGTGGVGTLEWADSALIADLSAATGITVNDLRNYLALQRYQEARNRFGSRYSEYIKYLVPGIGNLDSRLQEPEFLGGGSSMISFSEILQTQRTDTGETPLGTMAGHGISAMRTRRLRRFLPEHGIVMTLLSVQPKSIYTQALPKKWHRLNKEMYFQKELQFIGEQPIPNREVYAFHSDPTGTFGYNNRFDEYRWEPSGISGEFETTQDGWHYGRIFASDPALNNTFIACNPAKRPSADQVGHCLYVMANQSIQARRILAQWATPKTF